MNTIYVVGARRRGALRQRGIAVILMRAENLGLASYPTGYPCILDSIESEAALDGGMSGRAVSALGSDLGV